MKNKKSFRMSCLRLALLVVLGGFVWGAFTGIGKAKLKRRLIPQFPSAKPES